MNNQEFQEELLALGINLTEDQAIMLEKYYLLLIEYNKVMNLTGITEHDDVYLKHFYDSLTLIKAVDLNKKMKLCDMGSGAGFPGIVLKIVFPSLEVVLVDSLTKRTNFLKTVINTLDLKGIEVVNARLEQYASDNREIFDIVTARAVATMSILLELAVPLLKVNGLFIPLKGKIEERELSERANEILNVTLLSKYEFKLPKEGSQRNILTYKKIFKTSNKYPRKYDKIKKEPL